MLELAQRGVDGVLRRPPRPVRDHVYLLPRRRHQLHVIVAVAPRRTLRVPRQPVEQRRLGARTLRHRRRRLGLLGRPVQLPAGPDRAGPGPPVQLGAALELASCGRVGVRPRPGSGLGCRGGRRRWAVAREVHGGGGGGHLSICRWIFLSFFILFQVLID